MVVSVVRVFHHQPLNSYQCGFFSKIYLCCREPLLPPVDIASKRDAATSEGKAKLEKARKRAKIAMKIEDLANKSNLVI